MPRPVRDYEPAMIQKLFELVGKDAVYAAHLMGCHPTTVSKALAAGVTTKQQEVRAANAIERIEKESQELREKHADPVVVLPAPADLLQATPATRTLLVTVPEDKLANFTRVVHLMGAEQIPL